MSEKTSVIEFVNQALALSKVDIDIEYCKKNNIKYQNHEVDASRVDLFNSKANKAAFDLVFKVR